MDQGPFASCGSDLEITEPFEPCCDVRFCLVRQRKETARPAAIICQSMAQQARWKLDRFVTAPHEVIALAASKSIAARLELLGNGGKNGYAGRSKSGDSVFDGAAVFRADLGADPGCAELERC